MAKPKLLMISWQMSCDPQFAIKVTVDTLLV